MPCVLGAGKPLESLLCPCEMFWERSKELITPRNSCWDHSRAVPSSSTDPGALLLPREQEEKLGVHLEGGEEGFDRDGCTAEEQEVVVDGSCVFQVIPRAP